MSKLQRITGEEWRGVGGLYCSIKIRILCGERLGARLGRTGTTLAAVATAAMAVATTAAPGTEIGRAQKR